MEFMDLSIINSQVKKKFFEELNEIYDSSKFIGGSKVKKFEERFAKYIGARFCLGVANGTDALEIAIASLDIRPGSEVIVPKNTFASTAEAVLNCNLNIVWVETDASHNIDPKDLETKITQNTSAVIFVHLYGNTTNILSIKKITEEHDLMLIEDCAQAHGARYGVLSAGNFGDVAAFSFYPGKNLGAIGDAGGLVTNCEEIFFNAKRLANHGRIGKYWHEIVGRNSRLDSIQAAFLNIKLDYLDAANKARISNAIFYKKTIKNNFLQIQKVDEEAYCVFHHFVLQTRKVHQLEEHLSKHSIPFGVHYPYLLPTMPAFGGSKKLRHNVVSIPVHEGLNEQDRSTIAESLNNYRER